MIGGGRRIAHDGLDGVEAGGSTMRRRPSAGYRCFVLRGAGGLPAAGAPITTPLYNTFFSGAHVAGATCATRRRVVNPAASGVEGRSHETKFLLGAFAWASLSDARYFSIVCRLRMKMRLRLVHHEHPDGRMLFCLQVGQGVAM